MPALGVSNMGSANPWSNATYFWVVICRNVKVHKSENVMVGHKIPLAETDAVEPLPVTGPLLVKCDGCGEELSSAKILSSREINSLHTFLSPPICYDCSPCSPSSDCGSDYWPVAFVRIAYCSWKTWHSGSSWQY
jgi:hypothetical protein